MRADDDPYTAVSKEPKVGGIDLSFLTWVSWLAFSLAIIAGLVLGFSFGILQLTSKE